MAHLQCYRDDLIIYAQMPLLCNKASGTLEDWLCWPCKSVCNAVLWAPATILHCLTESADRGKRGAPWVEGRWGLRHSLLYSQVCLAAPQPC